MGGVDVGESGGKKRATNSDINMIPFIDLLMVTIAFLLRLGGRQLRMRAAFEPDEGVHALLPHGVVGERERLRDVAARSDQLDPRAQPLGNRSSRCERTRCRCGLSG